MKGLSGKRVEIPSMEEITQERKRLSYRRRYKRVLKSTAYALVVVAAIAVLLATNLLPVLQVSGDSMNPTLQDQDILVLLKTDTLEKGDLCGFYWQNKLLLKRIIGIPGDVISIDGNGLVTVNGEVLEEPYVDEPALGECDLSFPYQVPENRFHSKPVFSYPAKGHILPADILLRSVAPSPFLLHGTGTGGCVGGW